MIFHFRARLPVVQEPCNPHERQLAELVLPSKLARVLPLPVLLEKYEAGYMQHPDLLEELTEKIEERLQLEEARIRALVGNSLMVVSFRADDTHFPARA
jgi:hypothetical protein